MAFDFVCVGGGVCAGYWAEHLVEQINGDEALRNKRPSILIITGYVDGLLPYERPALSKGLLAPGATEARDFQSRGTAFPFTSVGSGRAPRGSKWYRDNRVTVFYGSECGGLDTAAKTVTVVTRWEGRRLAAKPKLKAYQFGSLLIATGCSPKQLGVASAPAASASVAAAPDAAGGASISSANGSGGSANNGVAAASVFGEACYCVRHADLNNARLEGPAKDRYGLGSAHFLRDIGDTIKLVKALETAWPPAPRGQPETPPPSWANDVLLVGGGFISMEVAAAIVTHYPNLKPTIVLSGTQLLPGLFPPEVAAYYEKRLAGVRFLRGYRAERLWPSSLAGELNTVGGPKTFAEAPPQFSECRGAVLRPRAGGADVYVPARVVLVAVGAEPNTAAFRAGNGRGGGGGGLLLAADGGIEVDVFLRTSAAAVFAAGDAATFGLALEGGRRLRQEHVQNARDMAVMAGGNMLRLYRATAKLASGGAGGGNGVIAGGSAEEAEVAGLVPYTPVPYCYSRFLDCSWKFYGVADGEVCVLGLDGVMPVFTASGTTADGAAAADPAPAAGDPGAATATGNGVTSAATAAASAVMPAKPHFGAFWVRDGRVVGAFLEGGTEEEQQVLEQIARERPKVFSAAFLKKTCTLETFLDDPGKLEAEDSDMSQLLSCCRCV